GFMCSARTTCSAIASTSRWTRLRSPAPTARTSRPFVASTAATIRKPGFRTARIVCFDVGLGSQGVEKPEPRVRGILRRALVVAKWAIGSLFILCLLLLGINAFDEDLSPEVRSLLTPLPNPYRPEENLCLALLGFDTKDGDPIKAGQARLAAYEIEAVVALKEPQRVPDAAWLQRVDLRFQGKVGFCTPLLQ